jgi:hypothetical protein
MITVRFMFDGFCTTIRRYSSLAAAYNAVDIWTDLSEFNTAAILH